MKCPRTASCLSFYAALAALLPLDPADGGETRAMQVTKADCARLVKHEPAPGVHYRPAVAGEAVARADLYGGVSVKLPRTVTIPIEADLFDRLGLPADRRFEGDVEVGAVALDLEDGRATFNGQPLSPPERAAIWRACRERLAD